MAGAGYRLFNSGDVLTAAQVNTYLQEQVVMRFADAAARTTALSGVLAEGMISYLDSTNAVEVYDGSNWVNVGNAGDITGVTAGTGISGGGTSGTVTITNDMATTITAKGDIVAGTGNATYDNLAVGSNGETVVADSSTSTGLRWAKSANFVGCVVYDSVGTQTIPNNVYTAVTFNAEALDTDAFHSTSTNTSRITIPSGLAGKYLVTVNTLWNLNGTGIRAFSIRKNGTGIYTSSELIGSASTYVGNGCSIITTFSANDYVELFVIQTSGNDLTLYKREQDSPFNFQFLGA